MPKGQPKENQENREKQAYVQQVEDAQAHLREVLVILKKLWQIKPSITEIKAALNECTRAEKWLVIAIDKKDENEVINEETPDEDR